VAGLFRIQSQAYISGVTVTATNTQTGVASTALTNESGSYNIPSLAAEPTAQRGAACFKDSNLQRCQLGQRGIGAIQLHAQVGALSDSVEVTGKPRR